MVTFLIVSGVLVWLLPALVVAAIGARWLWEDHLERLDARYCREAVVWRDAEGREGYSFRRPSRRER